MIEARDLMSVIWWCSFDQQAEEEHNLANRLRRVVTQSLKQLSYCALNMLNIWVEYYIPVLSPVKGG